MVISLERGADLHTAQLMPLPLAVSCFSNGRRSGFWAKVTRMSDTEWGCVGSVSCAAGEELWSIWSDQVHAPRGPGHDPVRRGVGRQQRSQHQVPLTDERWNETELRPTVRQQAQMNRHLLVYDLRPNLQNILRLSYDNAKVTINLR